MKKRKNLWKELVKRVLVEELPQRGKQGGTKWGRSQGEGDLGGVITEEKSKEE